MASRVMEVVVELVCHCVTGDGGAVVLCHVYVWGMHGDSTARSFKLELKKAQSTLSTGNT